MGLRVFITGGTGLIGRRLVSALLKRGDKPVVLSRRAVALDCDVVTGDPNQPGPWLEAAANCDAVVNLVGANLFARRWSADFKRELVDSRVKPTELLAVTLARGGKVKTLVQGSAVGYYGLRGDDEIAEDAPAGSDFLAKLCVDWEAAAAVAEAGVRVVRVRTGVVLDRAGGALPALARPFRFFVGGPTASGRQWLSWIHHADLTGLLLFALGHRDLTGPLNAVAPNPVTNRDFCAALAKQLGRPSWLPVPAFALRLALGEVADTAVSGQRVVPRVAQWLGFTFRFPTVKEALADLYGQHRPEE